MEPHDAVKELPLLDGIFRQGALMFLSTIGTFLMLYFRRLVSTLDSLKNSIIDLNTKLAVIVNEQDGTKEKIDDHEYRIRSLESRLGNGCGPR